MSGITPNQTVPGAAVFEGDAHWRNLPQGNQDTIGALALEIVAAQFAMDCCDQDFDDLPRAITDLMLPDGDLPLLEALREAFVEAIPREALFSVGRMPRVPSRLCGRSDPKTGEIT